MKRTSHLVIVLMVVPGLALHALAQEPAKVSQKESPMAPQELLKSLVGKWEGTVQTWFQPGKLADESEVSGEFSNVMGGHFVRHTYQGEIQGKPRSGEELIAFNGIAKQFQTSWVDDFHMNYAILFSVGEPVGDKLKGASFSVRADYDAAPGQPKWSWRTEYEFIDQDQLVITAYNITPDGNEAKAVQTTYRRVR